MFDALSAVKALVAPVIMISACGLLCLALYNRLAAIVGRARIFHKERFDALHKASTLGEEQLQAREHLLRRAQILAEQGGQILRRAKMIRNGLICLLTSVVLMIACSLFLGLAISVPNVSTIALGSFVLGSLTMLAGVVCALGELFRALDPVVFEMTQLEKQRQENPNEATL